MLRFGRRGNWRKWPKQVDAGNVRERIRAQPQSINDEIRREQHTSKSRLKREWHLNVRAVAIMRQAHQVTTANKPVVKMANGVTFKLAQLRRRDTERPSDIREKLSIERTVEFKELSYLAQARFRKT